MCNRQAYKISFKLLKTVLTSWPLQSLHIDFYEPIRLKSLPGRKYAYIIVDDHSTFT